MKIFNILKPLFFVLKPFAVWFLMNYIEKLAYKIANKDGVVTPDEKEFIDKLLDTIKGVTDLVQLRNVVVSLEDKAKTDKGLF